MHKQSNREPGHDSFWLKVRKAFSIDNQFDPLVVAFKITAIYIFLGAMWIVFSDWLMNSLYSEKEIINFISIIKGCVYVISSGALFFFFLFIPLKNIKNAGNKIEKSYQDLKSVNDKLHESEEFNKIVIEKMLNAFALHKIILDDTGKPCDYEFIDINPAFEVLTGLNRDNVIGKKYSQIVDSVEETNWIEIYGEVAITGEPAVFGSHTKTFDKWVHVNAYCPKKGYFISIFDDISEIKKNEEDFRISEERFRLAAEGSNDMIWDLDLLNEKSYISDRWYDFLGYKKMQDDNLLDKWNDLLNPEDVKEANKVINDYLEGKTSFYSSEYRLKCKNGEYKWFLCRGKALFNKNGEAVRFAGSLSDINDRKLNEIKLQESYEKLETTYEELFEARKELEDQYGELLGYQEKLHQNAYHDSLTGLPNRLLFYERIEQYINEKSNESKALFFIDTDNFKLINDTMGHSFGDELLVFIGKRLSSLFRDENVVYRFGGDEFVIFYCGFERLEEVEECAKKIINSLNDPFKIRSSTLHITVSIGISVYPQDGESAEILMKNADMAMYKAKAQGKSKYMFYNHDMQETVRERMIIEKHLRGALQNDEFLLYYQPQIDVKTGKTSGFEALIRWNNKELGLVSPIKFIGIAEETHLIIKIGEWVLEKACFFLKNLHERGHKNFTMAVNVSILQLMQEDFVDIVQKVIEHVQIEPKYLELEITESIMMESYQSVADKLYKLSKMGIKIALDDFGQGYSSLSYLKQLPINTLKIDKLFIDSINPENRKDSITGTIVLIGRKLGLTIVAEGVEKQEQMDYLKKYRCDKVQGFLISKPLTEEKAISFMGN